MKASRALLIASVLSLGSWNANAQEAAEPQPGTRELPQRYVSDKLVLNVYAEPDQASARVATIETGDAVGEIESSGSYVHVRLNDGREGWVGTNYLTREAPAAARLRELQDGQKDAVKAAEKKAADEISRLRKEAATLQSQLSELQAAAAKTSTATEVAPTPAETLPQVASENEREPTLEQPANRRSTTWLWSFAVVLAIGVGFTAGYQSLAGRLRKRYGKLKIY